MRIHELAREQLLPATRPEVFAFFGDAFNLERITPSWLGFRVVTPGPIPMRVGTLIAYRLRLRGVPVSWLTSIQDWSDGERFVDVQVRGPYALWHHTHEFADAPGGGTLVRDHVRYALPLGPLGELAHRALVRRDVEAIFDFRRDAVARELGG